MTETKKIEVKMNENKVQELNKILDSKPFSDLTQEDLIKIQNILSNAIEFNHEDISNPIAIGLRAMMDTINFIPGDNRTFEQFALDEIIDWITGSADEDYVFTEDSFGDVMERYNADGTMTYSSYQTKNYIRTFWDEFEFPSGLWFDENVESIFDSPEEFLVSQTENMVRRIIQKILEEEKVERMPASDFLKVIEEDNLTDRFKLQRFLER